ncbi:MAG: ABC transporter permease [Bacteroidia bacterium]
MKKQRLAFQAEWIKTRSSRMVWATMLAFGLAPLMGGVFILAVQHGDAFAQDGALAAKAEAMNFQDNWKSYFDILTQAIGVGGVMVFGFVASWIFGREYSDGTAKDLLALPTSRTQILNAKFMIYLIWCLMLVCSNLLVGGLIGLALQLSGPVFPMLGQLLSDYFITTILTILIGTPVAFFATWGKGYLPPLGAVALTLVLAQILAALGLGAWFPWSIPGLYSGAGGAYKDLLDGFSYLVVFLTALAGYLATVFYWNYTDQLK